VWNVKNKTDTNKDTGNWNRLKIIQKISDKRTWTAQHHGTTETSHTGHCAHISGSTDVKIPEFCYGK
jgi:hypothetical protein